MIVEVITGDQPCASGEEGELVVTELNNYAMPLVRYRTGDFASLSDDPCPCGRTLPVIENLFGRAYDIVVNKQGKSFHGEVIMYIFEEATRLGLGIAQFQFIQEELQRFHIYIVPGPEYSETAQELISSRLRQNIDADAEIIFTLVDSIQREKSGKMRLIVGLEK